MNAILKIIAIAVLGVTLGVATTLGVLWRASRGVASRLLHERAEAGKPRAPEKPWDLWTVELEKLANDLKEERLRMRRRGEAISQAEARILSERQELEKTRKQIEALRALIDRRLVDVAESETANLKRLSQSYSLLTPRAAVAITRELDETTLVKILSMMKAESVGSVLEEMGRQSASDPNLAKRAAVLSEKLRIVNTRKNRQAD